MDKRYIFFFIFFMVLTHPQSLYALTLVYSMKIRRVFEIDLPSEKKPHILFSVVPIVYKRKRVIHELQPSVLPVRIRERSIIGGTLFNFRYVPHRQWWFEVTTGLEKETSRSQGYAQGNDISWQASRTGFDDIICAAGHTSFLGKNAQFGLYGIAGVPARRRVGVIETYNTLVGTRFCSIGGGVEFSYSFVNSLKKTTFATVQARFLHFFSRHWSPILPRDALIQPGDVIDLLGALNYREKRNIFEVGLSPTFFTRQAVIVDGEKITGRNFVRHSVYAVATHIFKKSYFIQKPLILGTGISIGWARLFNTKIIAWWLNMTYVF